ncbi:hypothetical protein COV81_05220 [Candidatus Peregrinibacteria bacterium CG11_big_fil_rev_8_21_14_0_20_41_10]|nr:MAG: hypothetical protein COV81_05220 [Candidatus Peregrinibacteria bacterium CG11_big_fil_rev_8_21_14_0_20_41_10]PIZ74666.1 MAG: hypothetical protein COY06_03815 [Candidatus Peregrinibacteria bacterium CG_4_10_14_0_2_um_filter_41_8]PJC38311.1 MAG: hypothetical protein CO045_00895 [Candidatus Peregrinibacteria bacterium CG_4_9_14_0_2_um_filter_41_14]
MRNSEVMNAAVKLQKNLETKGLKLAKGPKYVKKIDKILNDLITINFDENDENLAIKRNNLIESLSHLRNMIATMSEVPDVENNDELYANAAMKMEKDLKDLFLAINTAPQQNLEKFNQTLGQYFKDMEAASAWDADKHTERTNNLIEEIDQLIKVQPSQLKRPLKEFKAALLNVKEYWVKIASLPPDVDAAADAVYMNANDTYKETYPRLMATAENAWRKVASMQTE